MDSEAPAKREQVAAVYQRQEEEAPAAESRAPRPPETATTAPKPKAATAPQPKVSAPPSGKIALNTATVSELEGLPGIGPSLAGKIVAYRTQHGPFKRIEDLEKVSGIGPKLLERLRPYLVL